jgi:Ca2+-binding RTX toxin-like protein
MATVTVAGAHGQVVTLTFDTTANAILAQKLAAAITAGVQAHTILPAVDTDGPPPPLPPGATGEFVQTKDGLTILPSGYKAVVDTAHEAVIFGSGDNGESVLSSIGDLTFIATGGSGTVAAGGGDNRIIVPPDDAGAWSINTGNGDDSVLALGGGNDTINAGGGHNIIILGSGKDLVQSTGDDTVFAGSGQETISAFGMTSDVVYGNASDLFLVATDGSATVFGGSGSDTFFGGKGSDLVYGGTGGNNLLFAGTGAATLFGGGNGDTLFGAGSHPQELHAGGGNETLVGGSGADTFYGGSGADRMIAGLGSNLFVFTDGQASGSDTIQGFTHNRDQIDLQGYGKTAVADALKSQVVAGGSDTITLTDNTRITFGGITSLTASDFIISNGNGNGNGNGEDHGHGNSGHGGPDDDGREQFMNFPFGHS